MDYKKIPKELIQNIVADRDARMSVKRVCEKYDVKSNFVYSTYFWYKRRKNGRSFR